MAPPELREQIHRVDFEVGHMMYLHEPCLDLMKEEPSTFYGATSNGGE